MAGLLSNFRNTVIVGLVLAAVMIFAFGSAAPGGFDGGFWQAVLRWAHVEPIAAELGAMLERLEPAA